MTWGELVHQVIGNLKVLKALEKKCHYLSALHLYSVLILFVLSQRKAVLHFGMILNV